MRQEVTHALDPLQFAFQEHIGVEDVVFKILHRTHTYLEEPGCYIRILIFDISSAINTIQPLTLRDKLERIGVDPSLMSWVTDCLTDQPQFVRLENCVSGTMRYSTGAPQGTVLAPFLFSLYTVDFKYNTKSCHMQKHSDMAIVACIRSGLEHEWSRVPFVGLM